MGFTEALITRGGKDKAVKRILLLEGSANVLVLLIKGVVGLSTGSMAIMGDALHSLTDVANNVVAWAVVRHSQKPADKEHPYGHHKFETLAVLGLSVLLVVLAFELSISAIKRAPEPPETSQWELALMLGVLVVNVTLATWQRYWAKRLQSDILHADASHTFADVLTTLVVISGWQLASIGYVWLDKLSALAVAGFIFYLAFQLFKKAAPILVDEYAIEPDKLADTARDIDGVIAVSQVRSRWVGEKPSVDMVIQVDASLSLEDSHKICDQVEALIEQRYSVTDISIHMEPFSE